MYLGLKIFRGSNEKKHKKIYRLSEPKIEAWAGT